MRIALAQLEPIRHDRDRALARGVEACEQAAAAGAQLVVLPEMWSSGYREPSAAELAEPSWGGDASDEQGEFVAGFRAAARRLGVAIGVTYLQSAGSHPRNALALVDSDGEIVLRYAKVHTCDFGVERGLGAGEAFPVTDLTVGAETVRVGTMICYDREFPESARLLMLAGAELILNPNASLIDPIRESQVLIRATENMTAIAFCNYAGSEFQGGSLLCDGMAYDRDGSVLEPIAARAAGAEEEIVLADLDLEELRAYRRYETWGNAYRRPHLYAGLTAEAVQEPFVREDARR